MPFLAALAAVLIAPMDGALAATPPCATTTAATFTVQVCLPQPAAGSTVSGSITVAGTSSVLSGSLRVARLVFNVDGGYTLSDFQSPYQFTLQTWRWVDGPHTLSVYAVMNDQSTSDSATESLTFSNGVTTVPANKNAPTITSGTQPSAGASFVVAAVGDGAGGDTTATAVANMVSSWSPNLFLYLGDVYEKGSQTEFSNWYDGAFGSLRPITDPVIGNHEYGTRKAAGYYDYWNNEPDYYSFDAGGWHFIALNSTSQFQAINWSGQLAWLQNDLAAHAGACTIAFWHHPLYNVGPEGPSARVQDFWTPLANARATLVLNGHDHDYQRWQPLDANGNPSDAGLTELVAGTGGHSAQYIAGSDPRLATSLSGAFGALQVQLSPLSAQYSFYTANGSTTKLFDSGTIPCRGYGTLAGTVTDSLTGNPIAGATVAYAGASAVTDGSGGYTLLKAPLGTYQLSAAAGGYTGSGQSVSVSPASTTTQNFSLNPLAGSVGGTVTDAATGQPVSGAIVSYSGGTATTDSSGGYSISGVTEGSYAFSTSALSYVSQTSTVTVGPGQAVNQAFSLIPTGTGSVGGHVTDAVTGSALAGASVSYLGGVSTTDSGGAYVIGQLPDGDNALTAAASGYSSQSVVVTISSEAPSTRDFALAPLPGTIGGSVSDSLTGKAIAGATVSYAGGTATTAADGSYSLAAVTEGSYTLDVTAAGFSEQTRSVTVTANASTSANFALAPLPGALTGSVRDAGSGAGVVGAGVSYSGGATVTDASGAYSLPNVTEGTYTVTAAATGYSPQVQTVSVSPGGSVQLSFNLVKQVFADGFESGSMSAWTTSSGVAVQTAVTHSGTYAAEATSTGAAVYARKTLSATYSNLYTRVYFDVRSLPTSTANVVGTRTTGGASLARVYIDSQGRLGMRNDVTSTSLTGPVVGVGAWHSVELHVVVNGASSTIEVWIDGNFVGALSPQVTNLGTSPVGQIQLAENQTGRSYDIALDDLVVQTARIGP